jgi:polyisoprenoid-binding protein YceI
MLMRSLAQVATVSFGISFGFSPAFAADVATPYELEPSSAAFLVITKKEGVASGFAHDHLIAAQDYKVVLSAPEGEPEKGVFRFVVNASSLTFDAPETQTKHFAALKAAGVKAEPFSPLSEGDRAKIKENALGASQLDAAKYPEILAEVTNLKKEGNTFQGREFSHTATVKITVKGKTVEKRLPANVTMASKELTVESVGAFAFSEFGIKAYSALFGAVRNADPFHIYVSFKARTK